MKNRIQSIINHSGLTQSAFADRIGVQRSAISHILSGRNNPGLDFLVRIMDNFPDISGDWLITGKGDMLKRRNRVTLPPQLFPPEEKQANEPEDQAPYNLRTPKKEPEITLAPINTPEEEQTDTKKETEPQPAENKPITTPQDGKTIIRVIIFYSDNTFEAYNK